MAVEEGIVTGPALKAGVSTRWAGAAIVVSGSTLLITISLYGALYGSVSATDPVAGVTSVDRADHLIENWGPLSKTTLPFRRHGRSRHYSTP